MNSGELRNRIDCYAKKKTKNEFGEVTFEYTKMCSVWAKIVTQSGKNEDLDGNSINANITHKITVRKSAIQKTRNDMYFMYKGQKYEVMYFMPNYLKNDIIEFYCKLIIEGDEDYGEN